MGSAALLASMLLASRAQAHNFRSVPIGGRTATMGGAGTAAGNDSAMPYLNPAGMAGVPNDIFAVSATVYSYSARTIDQFFAPNGFSPTLGAWQVDRMELSARSFFELPSSVMYFRRLTPEDSKNRVLLGGSLVIPSTEKTELLGGIDVRFPTVGAAQKDSVAVTRTRTDYYVGPSLAAALFEDRLRVGLSGYLFYSRSFYSHNIGSFFTMSNGSQIMDNASQASSTKGALSLAPIAGLQANLFSKVWLGLGVAVPTMHLSGDSTRESGGSNIGIDPNTGTPTTTRISVSHDGEFRSTRPLRLNAGVAWNDPGKLSFAVDVHYYAARDGAVVDSGTRREASFQTGQIARNVTGSYRDESGYRQVVNLSVGAEIGLNPWLALRLGGFTDLMNTEQKTAPTGADLFLIREDDLGATAGLGFHLGSFDSTFGVVYARQSGKIILLDRQVKADFVEADTSAHSLIFLLSGAVSKEAAKKTIQDTLPQDAPALQKVLP